MKQFLFHKRSVFSGKKKKRNFADSSSFLQNSKVSKNAIFYTNRIVKFIICHPFFHSLLPISTSWGVNWRYCSASRCPKIQKLLNINETVPTGGDPGWDVSDYFCQRSTLKDWLCTQMWPFYRRKPAAVCLMGFGFGMISSKHSRGSIHCNYFSLNDWWGRQKQIQFSDHMSGSDWRWMSQSSSP